MKQILLAIMIVGCVFYAEAATVVFTTDGVSTGDSLDGIGTNLTALSVLEVPGLNLNIAAAIEGHTLNANAGDFGVTSGLGGEVNDRFDFGEAVLMSFDQDVQITLIDFSDFDSGEVFNFIIGTTTNVIAWSDLSNQISDIFDGIAWDVSAGEIIRMEVAGGTDSLSMDSVDVTVVPEPATMAMFGLGGAIAWVIRRSSRK